VSRWPPGRYGLAILACTIAVSCSRTATRRPLDLDDGRGARLFFVLGMLDEYTGRHVVEDDDRVEGFYCNETAKVPAFLHQLEQLAREQQLSASIRRETVEGCFTVVRSAPIAAALNSLYQTRDAPRIEQSWTIDESGRRRRNERLWAGPELFRGVPRALKLAYVAGAYNRYGKGNWRMKFANSQQKVALLVALLNEFGCSNVRTESTQGFIPQSNTIRFDECPDVRQAIERPPS
jgi:hypothetical protein